MPIGRGTKLKEMRNVQKRTFQSEAWLKLKVRGYVDAWCDSLIHNNTLSREMWKFHMGRGLGRDADLFYRFVKESLFGLYLLFGWTSNANRLLKKLERDTKGRRDV